MSHTSAGPLLILSSPLPTQRETPPNKSSTTFKSCGNLREPRLRPPSRRESHCFYSHYSAMLQFFNSKRFRYTQEMISLNSLESCAVKAVNPVRKSCWEIKSLHPYAPSGVYKIRGPGGEPLSVQCDMTKQGGGWTLAGVAIFGQNGKAGTFLPHCIVVVHR